MADTRLILHVKGTEAETEELPKEDVKTAVAHGRLSYSQLIWSATEHAWKQIREWPELLPGESLILHVKGTESQTRELPKQAVKSAIFRGEITHSQLIWSANDGAWKQVRELPDLLPGETLILHVKGTEAETRELPKPAIRAAISRGEITQSQLIWSPLDQAWKPVADMPDLVPGESLILHVKGSTADTKEMPKKAIRTAIKEGSITHSQLIWSTPDHQWKQVRDLPELLPSQKLAPAPVLRDQVPVLDSSEPTVPQVRVAAPAEATPRVRPRVVGPPRVTIASAHPPAGQAAASPSPKPMVSVAQTAVPSPQARVAVVAPSIAAPGATPPAETAPTPEPDSVLVHPEEHEEGFPAIKWLCIALGALLGMVLAGNYFMVDWPFRSNFARTPYASVFVYAHYGAFVQPNVVVIHIPASAKLTPDNITDFLAALAASTPKNPITGDYFERVALTSGWVSQYSFAGSAWKELGDMQHESAEDREIQILSAGTDAAGKPLLEEETTLGDEAREARRERAWKAFVGSFTQPGS
jgi:hypothetical protein